VRSNESVAVVEPLELVVLVQVITMVFEKPSFANSFVLTINEPSVVENVITAVVMVAEPASVNEKLSGHPG